jgi:hypothetical protein
MGFDIIPNPTHQVTMIPIDSVEPGTSTSPGSLPGLSRSDGTTSTISPGTEFPVLPLVKPLRLDHPSQGEQEDGEDDQDEADEWDMIETGRPGESTGDNTDDELIFLDEESLMAMKKADQDKKLANDALKNRKGRMLDYAGTVKA